jgi:hypothetical protein
MKSLRSLSGLLVLAVLAGAATALRTEQMSAEKSSSAFHFDTFLLT